VAGRPAGRTKPEYGNLGAGKGRNGNHEPIVPESCPSWLGTSQRNRPISIWNTTGKNVAHESQR
jgi:hypothetical protein